MQTHLHLQPNSERDGLFHPAVSGWLRSRFGQPTEVQERAWTVTAEHRNALIAAPTGSGKTTFLQILSAPQVVRFIVMRQQFGDRIRTLRGGGGPGRGRQGGRRPGPLPLGR